MALFKIHKVSDKESMPFSLLLLADETVEAIEKYIYQCDVFTVFNETVHYPIAVFALLKLNDDEVEIKNIAVLPEFQNKGLGSLLLKEIRMHAFRLKFKRIVLGTPDVDYGQIRFYKKNGFVKHDLIKDFYLKNYPKPIFEKGIVLKDMAIFKLDLFNEN